MGKPSAPHPHRTTFLPLLNDKSFTWLSGVRREILEIPLALGRTENVIAPKKDSREAPKVTMVMAACLLKSYSLFPPRVLHLQDTLGEGWGFNCEAHLLQMSWLCCLMAAWPYLVWKNDPFTKVPEKA